MRPTTPRPSGTSGAGTGSRSKRLARALWGMDLPRDRHLSLAVGQEHAKGGHISLKPFGIEVTVPVWR